jgi:DNA-binding XRE family transcriptional regulator
MCQIERTMPAVRTMHYLLLEARRALQMSQRQFGYTVGASHRTAVRWDAGKASPAAHHYAAIVKLLYPVDRALAAEIAGRVGQSLVSLGIEAPPPPPVESPASPPETLAAPSPPRPPAEDLVDLMLLAAMVESGAPVDTVRKWLHAALARGSAVHLTMEEAERALRPRASP